MASGVKIFIGQRTQKIYNSKEETPKRNCIIYGNTLCRCNKKGVTLHSLPFFTVIGRACEETDIPCGDCDMFMFNYWNIWPGKRGHIFRPLPSPIWNLAPTRLQWADVHTFLPNLGQSKQQASLLCARSTGSLLVLSCRLQRWQFQNF